MDQSTMNNNVATLTGVVTSEITFSHRLYGEAFYDGILSVPRLSNEVDRIPFTVPERLLESGGLQKGMMVTMSGQMRSYNKLMDGKSKLLLTLFVRELPYDDGGNSNSIDIIGYVCKPPVFRVTPFGREICDILLAVNRAYNKSDYLPCIAWGRNARFIKTAKVGDKVIVNGRIQSRDYQKTIDDEIVVRTAYEISVNRIDFCE